MAPRNAKPDTDDAPRWIEYVPVDEVVPADRNPKKHALADLQASMRRFGFTEAPLRDGRTGKLVAGHGRQEALGLLAAAAAAAEAGEPIEPPEGIVVGAGDGRWRVPVQCGWSSADDAEAEAYLMASNRLSEKGGWHEAERAALLEDLQNGPGFDGIGYSAEDFQSMLAELAKRNPDAPPAFPRIGDDIATDYECPRCAYEWSGQPRPTQKLEAADVAQDGPGEPPADEPVAAEPEPVAS